MRRRILDFDDARDHGVEQVSIVGDHEDRALVLILEERLQPEAPFQVEVVGGLVEQQDVGLLQEQAGEGDARLLTAGEVSDPGFRTAHR